MVSSVRALVAGRRAFRPAAMMLLSVFVAGLAMANPSAEVLEVERARVAALVRDDYAALEGIFADDLTYVHSNGTVESKSEYLATLRSGRLKYTALDHADQVVRVFGDAALLQGTSAVRAISAGTESTVRLRFTMLYVRKGGRWQLVTWQSTRLP